MYITFCKGKLKSLSRRMIISYSYKMTNKSYALKPFLCDYKHDSRLSMDRFICMYTQTKKLKSKIDNNFVL